MKWKPIEKDNGMNTEEKIRQHLVYGKIVCPVQIVIEYFPLGVGESISIQASRDHYCSPKENLEDRSKYESVEVYHGDTILSQAIQEFCERAGIYFDDQVAGPIPIKDLAGVIDKEIT